MAKKKRAPSAAQRAAQAAFARARKFYKGRIPKGADLSRFRTPGTAAQSTPRRVGGGGMLLDVVGLTMEGAKQTLPILSGKVVARGVPMVFRLSTETPTAAATAAAAAVVGTVGAGVVASRFLGRGWGELIVAGGLLDIAESMAKRFGVPGSQLLGDSCDVLAGHTLMVGTYDRFSRGPVSRMRLTPGAGPLGTYRNRLGTYVPA